MLEQEVNFTLDQFVKCMLFTTWGFGNATRFLDTEHRDKWIMVHSLIPKN